MNGDMPARGMAPRAIKGKPMTFEQDKDETPVLFRMGRGKGYKGDGAVAVFPCEPHDMSGDTMTCYVHVGQHGACDLGWYRTRTRAAKPEEYAALKLELESAPYGYRLRVYSRMQPWMREAHRVEVQRLRELGNK